MKSYLAATGLAAVMMAGMTAQSHAATVNCSSSPETCYFESEGTLNTVDSFTFGRDNKNKLPGGKKTFTDFFTFTLSPSLSSLDSQFSLSGDIGMSVTAYLYAGNATYTPGAPAKVTYDTSDLIGSFTVGQKFTTDLSDGDYYVYVTGTTGASTGSGNYSGTASVSAVPLPGSVGLFGVAVAGLGLVGMMRRRSAAAASA